MSTDDDHDFEPCSACIAGRHDQCFGCDCNDDWHYAPADAPEGPEDECEGAPDDELEDDGDDHYDEFKDGVAMGYINQDGTQREPDEPDWGAEDSQ